METKYEQEVARFEDVEAQRTKEIGKLRETLGDTQRNYDLLKRKYAEEVDQLKLTSEEESASRSDKIRELEA